MLRKLKLKKVEYIHIEGFLQMFLEETDKNIRKAEESGLHSKIHQSHQKFCKQKVWCLEFVFQKACDAEELGE